MSKPCPPTPLPDIQFDRRTPLELARDEYAAGRLTLDDYTYHVEKALEADA